VKALGVGRRGQGILEDVVTIFRDIDQLARSVLNAVVRAGSPDNERYDSLREFQAEIWNLQRLIHAALGNGVEQDIIGAFDWFAKHGDAAERAIVVWIDLVETLVQGQERRYGRQPGLGAIKKAELKEVIGRLLVARELRIPIIPQVLMPIFLEIFVDWMVDAIVSMSNRYSLWATDDQPRNAVVVLMGTGRKWLGKVFRPLFSAIVLIYSRISSLFRRESHLSPELMTALEAVEREGFIEGVRNVLGEVSKFIIWISEHRKQLTAAVELIFEAVQQAEAYIELPGPEKRVYAEDLILAVLDEMGFKQRAGLVFAIINSFTGTGIEAAVHLFNKRGVFSHQRSAG
jgi:hypothetical protein